MGKILKVIGISLLAVILVLVLSVVFLALRPAVGSHYYENTASDAALEAKYAALGTYQVASKVYKSDGETFKRYKVWYPENIGEGERLPAVVMVNGTGVPYQKYQAVFRHLASWGFIVIGNDDESSWSGQSACSALKLLLELDQREDSPLFRRVDGSRIGVAGHSQGGVGAINAVTDAEVGNMFTALYTASCTQRALAEALEWSYDVRGIRVPYFAVAGTGDADAGMIAPLFSLEENFDALPGDTEAAIALRSGKDHGEMLYCADGYMTAWFRYTLMDDWEAAEVFVGNEAELTKNENWQDVHIRIG